MSTAITDPAWKFRSHADVKKENKWLWVIGRSKKQKSQINETNISD